MAVTQNRPKSAPGPRGHFLWGSLPEYRQNPLRFFLGLREQFGDVVHFRLGRQDYFLLAHPAHIQYVLQQNVQNYIKGKAFKVIEALTGLGLVTSEGELWRRHRQTINPVFHRQGLASFATAMVAATEAMLERWQAHVGDSAGLDVEAEMVELTLAIVTKALLGTEAIGDVATLMHASDTARQLAMARLGSLIRLPLSWPTPRNRRFRQAMQTIDRVAYRIVDEHRRGQGSKTDMVSMMLQARDGDGGQGMSNQELRDEVVTHLLAGHATTATALTWTWYLLFKYPNVLRKMEEELASVLAGRSPMVADLPRLVYTRMVVQEAMRLYPPVYAFPREVLQEDEIGGYRIPAHAVVQLSPYITHRHPSFWQNPEGFEPERFSPESAAHHIGFAYFPFGGGQRICIGKDFALLEAQLVLATVAQRYRLYLVPGHPVEPRPTPLVLALQQGLRMTLHPITPDQAAGEPMPPPVASPLPPQSS